MLPLLKEFGTVESIYEFLDSHTEKEAKEFMKEIGIGRPPYKNLMEGRSIGLLSKELATIKCDMTHFTDLTLEDLLITLDRESMIEVFTELQFNSLLK